MRLFPLQFIHQPELNQPINLLELLVPQSSLHWTKQCWCWCCMACQHVWFWIACHLSISKRGLNSRVRVHWPTIRFGFHLCCSPQKQKNSVCKVKYQRHISSLNRRGRRGAWVPITPFFVYVFRDLTMYVLEIHSSSLSSLPQTRVCSVVYISAKLSWRQPFTVFITQWGQ